MLKVVDPPIEEQFGQGGDEIDSGAETSDFEDEEASKAMDLLLG